MFAQQPCIFALYFRQGPSDSTFSKQELRSMSSYLIDILKWGEDVRGWERQMIFHARLCKYGSLHDNIFLF
jgi:hypothetical protein